MKWRISIFLLLALCLCLLPTASTANSVYCITGENKTLIHSTTAYEKNKVNPYRHGDVNNDGNLAVGDVAKIYAHCKGAARITDQYLILCADYDGDGNITVGDVAQVYAYIKSVSKPDADKKVPSYVEQEASRVADLVRSKQTENSLVFAALSDVHYPYEDLFDGEANTAQSMRHAAMGIAQIQSKLSLDFVGLFGDYVAGGPGSTLAESRNALKFVHTAMDEAGVNVPQIWMQGNHDRNPYDTDDGDLTSQELYAFISSHTTDTVVDSEHPTRGYGYRDFEEQKVRVIYWNSSDVSEVESATDHCFSAYQYRWMADTAFDFSDKTAPSQWGIVMLSHMPVNWSTQLTAFVDAYISGQKVTLTAADGIPVTVDFTEKERAEFICAVNGHTHNFRYSRVGSNRFWQIAVPQVCAGRYNEYGTSWPEMGGELDSSGNPIYHLKTADSAQSTSFCIFVVDRENRKLHALHYGAGIDRQIDY